MSVTTCGEKAYICEKCAQVLGLSYSGGCVNDAGRKACSCCQFHPWRLDLKDRQEISDAMSRELRNLSMHLCTGSTSE